MPRKDIHNKHNLRPLLILGFVTVSSAVSYSCIQNSVALSITSLSALIGAILIGAFHLIHSRLDQVYRDQRTRPVLVRVSKRTFPERQLHKQKNF